MTSGERLPDHLTFLPDESVGRWALWRTVCVRGAGFPAADVLRLADPECAAAADGLAAVAEEAETLRQAALEALRGELAAEGGEELGLLVQATRRARRYVKRSRPVSTEGLPAVTRGTYSGQSGGSR